MTAIPQNIPWDKLTEKQKEVRFQDACRTGFDRRVDQAASILKRDIWGFYAIHPKKGKVRSKRGIAEAIMLVGQQTVNEIEQNTVAKTLHSIADIFDPRGPCGFGC